MAAPQPKAHRPQVQRMTVALRNICRDYPAGGGVLRELLQNADDASATSVRFVLDLRSYPTDHLLHPDLATHQGPALLAYNSAVFSEEDFESLSRIGDSRKLQDGCTTGKFGRGFNSVYNWTDSPSIVSESTLLILDPHHGWSATFKNSIPGGPTYDFVANAESKEMKNQMSAFSAIMKELDRPFQGTIIRIPLRTKLQAAKSEICKRPTTASDIEEVVRKFSSEFGISGLLFMKNVDSIRVEIGDAVPFHMEIANAVDVRRNKQLVNEAIQRASRGVTGSFDLSFEIEIMSTSPVAKSRTSFAVHHSIADSPADEKLREWCKAQAMLPWIAVAAQTPVDVPEANCGSLFTVLPLQISTCQPVHIHGLFSLSTDRARFHRNSDTSIQDQLPAKWNEWLFDEPIPVAWVNMLLYLADQHSDRSAFTRWPSIQDSRSTGTSGMIQKVLQIIQEKCSALWYTDLGYIGANRGLLANGDESSDLRKALYNVQVPVIYLPVPLLSYVQGHNMVERLNPASLCRHLREKVNQVRDLAEDAKQVILEYVLSDPSFREYGAIELFPFEDNSYKSIDNIIAFIHRDEKEQAVFDRDRRHNIDLHKVSKNTLQILKKGLLHSSLHSSLCERSSNDLTSYCLSTYFKDFDGKLDVVDLDDDAKAFMTRVWDWIVSRDYKLSNNGLASLWLVPLSNGQYRKLSPTNQSSGSIYAPPGEMGDFIRKISTIDTIRNKPIVLQDALSSRALQLLIAALVDGSSLMIKNGAVLEDFVIWLNSISDVIERATDEDKLRLQELLVTYRHLYQARSRASDALRELKIFRKVTWMPSDGTEPSFTWTSLKGFSKTIGLRDYVPVPNEAYVLFLDAKSDITTKFLSEYQLATCPSTLSLLTEHVIPFWESGRLESLSVTCREQITRLLLRHFFEFGKVTRGKIEKLPFIPVSSIDGKKLLKFACAAQLIDSSNHLLRSLFFDDEEVCPAEWVMSDYKGVLNQCGLRTSLTGELAMNRIRRFADIHEKIEPAWDRGRVLLRSKVEWGRCTSPQDTFVLKDTRWVPAVDLHSTKILTSPTQSRGLSDKVLVGLVIPTINFYIDKEWMERMGWNEMISSKTVLAQLEKGIEKKDREIVNAVLKYIQAKGQFDVSKEALMNLRCVLTQTDCFVSPQNTFRKGCQRLGPYLHNVDNSFWHDHGSLLTKLGIKEEPDPKSLLRVQTELQRKVPLDESGRDVAIETIKLAAVFGRDQLSNLKIVTATGSLCAIEDVTYDDLAPLSLVQGTVNYTHPDIPRGIIVKLRIEPLSERVKKGQLDLADVDDEDEFDQREEVATGIADTLDRYPVESTFKEYIANADDAEGATKISWLLDARQHPQVSVLTSELSAYQGHSLIVHNDGTFLEKDFDGLKHVGRGSKREDSSTIGKFGRGSQTMYHWTDVPMLLSGKFLLILDPLQQVLPMNYRRGHRKSGVKIELSRVKSSCPDQLAPFDGLFGYSQDMDYYSGTIFRFPLRPAAVQSRLRESNTPLDYGAAQNYMEEFFDDARISLLFLRNVRSLEFKVYGETHPRWSVKSSRGVLDRDFSDWTYCTVTKGNGLTVKAATEDRWWTAIQDPPDLPMDLLHRHKRTMKDVECGIAALVDSIPGLVAKSPSASQTRVFSTLPLPFALELPVHLHATFLTTGDRQSIVIESSAREAGADWNRWLLASAIPVLYLAFLEDLGRKIGHDAFEFWPTKLPSKGSLSELVYNSFWQQIQLPENPFRLFPLARQQDSKKKRQLPKLLEIKEATFDFLANDTLEALREILESQIPTLVRVPFAIRRKLQSLTPRVTSITPTMLRKLFRTELTGEILAKSKTEPKVLELLLKEIMPVSNDDLEELNGCRVLPLADNTIGMLNIMDPLRPGVTYYLATKREIALFNFALGLLTPEDLGKDFKNALLNYDRKFNIKRLDISDIGVLLKEKNFLSNAAGSNFDSWLLHFWKYWHEREIQHKESSKATFLSASGVRDYNILQATCDGAKTYLKPSDLESLPSIIEPEDKRHKRLCDKIAGIYRINGNYIPGYIKAAETSLVSKPSFARFVKSLSVLAAKQGGIENYIRNTLGTTELEILQELAGDYLQAQPADEYAIESLIRQLPIWPSIVPPNQRIPASFAMIAANYALLVPWMSEYSRFIRSRVASSYQSALETLGVPVISDTAILKAHILPRLPQSITPDEENSYGSFIEAVSRVSDASNPRHFSKNDRRKQECQQFLDLLCNSRLAIDGNRVLQKANTLFDHDDIILQAAFRKEVDTRFLSTRARVHRQFWIDLGLRHMNTGDVDAEVYTLCLHTIQKRLSDGESSVAGSQLASDIAVVLRPLTSSSINISNFSYRGWQTIQNEAILPASTVVDGEPTYKRDLMASLANKKPLLHLKDVINRQYIPVCWSQTSFPLPQPSGITFSNISSRGKPPVSMVWAHLKHLMQSAEHLTQDTIPEFLTDLASTYDFLLDNLDESRDTFTLVASPLWLNLSITDNSLVRLEDLNSSWYKIEHLILLSSCDSPPLKSVQPRLMQHERLLKALGCISISYPTTVAPDIDNGESLSATMSRFRRDGKMLDLTLSAEGKHIKAHKVILAAASAPMAANFSGNWANEPIIQMEDIRFDTLSMVVDFAYADVFDWTPMRVTDKDTLDDIANKLDNLLDLLTAADRFFMPTLKSQVENEFSRADRFFLRIDNVLGIQARAAEARAHHVENMCARFYEKNRVPVDLVMAQPQ